MSILDEYYFDEDLVNTWNNGTEEIQRKEPISDEDYFDSYQESLESWKTEKVRQWKLKAMRIQRMHYLMFGNCSTFNHYENSEKGMKKLQASLCLGIFGPATNEIEKPKGSEDDLDLLLSGYDKKQKETSKMLVKKIKETHNNYNGEDPKIQIKTHMIFVLCLEKGKNEFIWPLIGVSKGGSNIEAKEAFIDVRGRVYEGWRDFQTNNNLPRLKYCYPRFAFYSCSKVCKFEFDPEKLPNLVFANSPNSTVRSRNLEGLDFLVSVASLGMIL